MRTALLKPWLAALVVALVSPVVAGDRGQALAWGTHLHYLGDGQFTTNSMVAPAGLSNVVWLASGLQHVAALRLDGSVASFGESEWGLTSVPADLTNALTLSAGDYHTLALTRTRQVRAWGAGFNSQCRVPPEATNVVAVAAGGYHSLALRADGQVLAGGDNRYGQCNVPADLTNALALAAGIWHNLALLDDGRVRAWGGGGSGQLNVPASLTNVIALAARASYSLALKADGSVVGWGLNDAGQLTLPASVRSAVGFAAGGSHALARLADGKAVGWGSNSVGQATVPAGLSNASALSAGSWHSAVALGIVPPSPAPPQPGVVVRADRRLLLTAGVPGSQPMKYQWLRAGVMVPGATNSLLVINRMQPGQAGTYSVIASNPAGAVTNVVAQVEVWVPELARARFLWRDDSTLGNWKGVYGTQASVLFGHATNGAAGTLALTSGQVFAFQTNTPDARALERVDSAFPTNRYSGCAFGANFVELQCAFPRSATNQLALYLMEPGGGRAVSVQIIDQVTGDVLDVRSLGALANGSYLAWEITGPVRVRLNRVAGANAILSGAFLGWASGQPPTLRVQPASQSVAAGTATLLAVGGSGEPALAYQWRANGLPLADGPTISGARSPILTLNSVTAGTAGSYSVTVTNMRGTATSAPATVALLSAGQPPTITSQPVSRTNSVGGNVTFSVSATGTAPLAYQWRFNGASLAAATQSTLALTTVQLSQAGSYTVVVTNNYGSVTSAVAQLQVLASPTASARFLFRDDSTMGNWKGVYGTQDSIIFGHVTNVPAGTLTLTRGESYPFNTNCADARALERVDAESPTNRYFGCVFATDYVELQCAFPPAATNQLAVYVVEPGGGRAVSVEVFDQGTGILLDSRQLSAISNSTYLNWEVAGPVRVRVNRVLGANAVISGAFLGRTVGTAPSLRVQPLTRAVALGARAVLAVGANGEPALAFQWQKDGLPLADGPGVSGVRSPILTLKAMAPTNVGSYSVTVTNARGNRTSLSATVSLIGVGQPLFMNRLAYRLDSVGLRLSGSGVPGQTYLIQAATALPGPWWNVSTNQIPANGVFEWSDITTGTTDRRFYRAALP
jgi:hypothetical protein